MTTLGLLQSENKDFANYFNLFEQYFPSKVVVLNKNNFLKKFKEMDIIVIPSYEVAPNLKGFYPLVNEFKGTITAKGDYFQLNCQPHLKELKIPVLYLGNSALYRANEDGADLVYSPSKGLNKGQMKIDWTITDYTQGYIKKIIGSKIFAFKCNYSSKNIPLISRISKSRQYLVNYSPERHKNLINSRLFELTGKLYGDYIFDQFMKNLIDGK